MGALPRIPKAIFCSVTGTGQIRRRMGVSWDHKETVRGQANVKWTARRGGRCQPAGATCYRCMWCTFSGGVVPIFIYFFPHGFSFLE